MATAQEEMTKVESKYLGRFARSIESGWLGKVVAVEDHDCPMLKMQGVNLLCWQVAGGAIDEFLDDDDIQWFDPADVRLVKLV